VSHAGAYVGVMLIGMGLAETTALLGFVGVFLTHRLWPYLLGMAFSLVGLTLIAPSREDIERRQRDLTDRRLPLSLGEALLGFRR
jgi:hypothetical protein